MQRKQIAKSKEDKQMWTPFKCPSCNVEWADADIAQEEVEAVGEDAPMDKDGNYIAICDDCK